ncbi:MAG: YggT family protein [bacterium]
MSFINYLIYSSVSSVVNLINFLVLIRIILSWVPMGQNTFSLIIYNLTEPLLQPIRKMVEDSPLGGGMMLDFSPMILVLILGFIQSLVASILF